jgi:cell division protein ZapA
MNAGKTVDVSIMGRDFRVTCPDEERDQLLQSVAYLDQKIREIRDAGKVIGSERVAIMAALSVTHELLTARTKQSFDMEEFKRRIGQMQAMLDAAMPEQDKLF